MTQGTLILADEAQQETRAVEAELLDFAGGLNRNVNDPIDSMLRRIAGLSREDYAVPANRLMVTEAQDHQGRVVLHAGHDHWTATPYAVDQLSDRLSKGLRSFGNEMADRGHHDLRVYAINELLNRADSGQKFQVRSIQPNGHRLARAVVSDKFKPIDDDLCVPPMIDLIADRASTWRSLGGQITDTRTYLKFLNREPAIRGIGPNNRDWFLGFMYSNSEVGQGLCQFHLFLYDSFCSNGCIFGMKSILDVNFRHIGAKIKTGFGLISDERVQDAELASIRGLISDATASVLSADFSKRVREYVERGESRTLADASDKAEAIRQIGKAAGLTLNEADNAVAMWDSREPNSIGVANAVTRLAQDAKTYSARVRLEQAGGSILEMDDRKWKSVMALAS